MKIKFFVSEKHPSAATTWPEISKSHFREGYDKLIFDTVQVLERKDDLINKILNLRKELSIPRNGYDINDFDLENYCPLDEIDLIHMIDAASSKQSGGRECRPSKKHGLLSSLQADYPQVDSRVLDQYENIVYFNCIFPRWSVIYGFGVLESEDNLEKYIEYNICVTKKVSANRIKQFIEEHRLQIEFELNKLPAVSSKTVTQRDMEIIELKDKNNMSLKKIADVIANKYTLNNNSDGRINEDSVKTAYHRAKDRIKSFGR
jgi:hypothetical protein